jgi:hypothetical protein
MLRRNFLLSPYLALIIDFLEAPFAAKKIVALMRLIPVGTLT